MAWVAVATAGRKPNETDGRRVREGKAEQYSTREQMGISSWTENRREATPKGITPVSAASLYNLCSLWKPSLILQYLICR